MCHQIQNGEQASKQAPTRLIFVHVRWVTRSTGEPQDDERVMAWETPRVHLTGLKLRGETLPKKEQDTRELFVTVDS